MDQRSPNDLALASGAYSTLNTTIAAVMTRSRDRRARRLAAATLSKGGGGVIYDFTVIALDRVLGPDTLFIDTRSA